MRSGLLGGIWPGRKWRRGNEVSRDRGLDESGRWQKMPPVGEGTGVMRDIWKETDRVLREEEGENRSIAAIY